MFHRWSLEFPATFYFAPWRTACAEAAHAAASRRCGYTCRRL